MCHKQCTAKWEHCEIVSSQLLFLSLKLKWAFTNTTFACKNVIQRTPTFRWAIETKQFWMKLIWQCQTLAFSNGAKFGSWGCCKMTTTKLSFLFESASLTENVHAFAQKCATPTCWNWFNLDHGCELENKQSQNIDKQTQNKHTREKKKTKNRKINLVHPELMWNANLSRHGGGRITFSGERRGRTTTRFGRKWVLVEYLQNDRKGNHAVG